jgi:hypothetical protein
VGNWTKEDTLGQLSWKQYILIYNVTVRMSMA